MRWPSLQTRGCESHGGSDAELSGRRSTFRHGRDYVSITVPAFSERLDVNKLPSYHGRLPKTMKQVTIYRNWIQNLLQQGKIRKLPQKPRFTLPVRIVNERVTHDCRPLLPFITTDGRFPNLQSCWPIVTWAAQQPHLAKIDLKKAFHSIPLANDQIGAYAFELEGNYYAYMTMPMGATNAPKHFHQVMGIILSKLPFSHDIRYYQDDIF
ncbi:RNA-directed DNA polymerase, partial [Gregarina niphandrodes]